MEHVYLAVPTHDGRISLETHRSIIQATAMAPRGCGVYEWTRNWSLLCANFNHLWADALNRREELNAKWFVMLHSDVGALQPDWLPVLIAEAEAHDLDALSAVMPIKDYSQDTSTALWCPETHNTYRLNYNTLMDFPDTFSNDFVKQVAEKPLCINTGMLAMRLDRKWSERFGFYMEDGIERNEDGKFVAKVLSEDWAMSLWFDDNSVPYGATQVIPVVHMGNHGWTHGRNDAWTTPYDLQWLKNAAADMHVIVELGAWRGRATRVLAEACNGTVYAVDMWSGTANQPALVEYAKQHDLRKQFDIATTGLDNVVAVTSHSALAVEATGVADMVFIDADHSYEAVLRDIEAWLPFCRKLICGHDIDESGVLQAVTEKFGNKFIRPTHKLWAVYL